MEEVLANIEPFIHIALRRADAEEGDEAETIPIVHVDGDHEMVATIDLATDVLRNTACATAQSGQHAVIYGDAEAWMEASGRRAVHRRQTATRLLACATGLATRRTMQSMG